MKQILITLTMLSVAVALIISVLIPIFKHASNIGSNAINNGKAVTAKFENVTK